MQHGVCGGRRAAGWCGAAGELHGCRGSTVRGAGARLQGGDFRGRGEVLPLRTTVEVELRSGEKRSIRVQTLRGSYVQPLTDAEPEAIVKPIRHLAETSRGDCTLIGLDGGAAGRDRAYRRGSGMGYYVHRAFCSRRRDRSDRPAMLYSVGGGPARQHQRREQAGRDGDDRSALPLSVEAHINC